MELFSFTHTTLLTKVVYGQFLCDLTQIGNRKIVLKKIGESTSLNTYSGKWNIHQLESDDAIEMFKYKMQLVKL